MPQNSDITMSVPLRTDGLIRREVAGIRWACQGGYHVRLFTASAPDWAHLEDDPRAERLKQNPRREVFRVCWEAEDVIVKKYFLADFASWCKQRLRGGPQQREMTHLQLAHRRGVPVPQPLACGVGRGFALLLMRTIPSRDTLEDLLWQDEPAPPSELRSALTAAAVAVARMHTGGVTHGDLHPGNILIQNDSAETFQAWITDLQDIAHNPRATGTLRNPSKPHLNNLATLLLGTAKCTSPEDRDHFLKTYWQAARKGQSPTGPTFEQFCQDVSHLMQVHFGRLCRQWDRRVRRNSRYARRISLPGGWQARTYLQHKRPCEWSPVSNLQFTSEQWQQALSTPEELLQNGQVYKEGSSRTVRATTLAVGPHTLDVIVKQYLPETGIMSLLQALRPSRAFKNWTKAFALVYRDIPTAWPLAVLEHGRGPTRQSLFICARIDNATDLKALVAESQSPLPLRQRRALSQQIADYLVRMIHNGIRHRDGKATNLMIQRRANAIQSYFVDLDGVQVCRFGVLRKPHQALIRLGASLLIAAGVNRTDYCRVFRGYLSQWLPQADRRQSRQFWRQWQDAIWRNNQVVIHRLFFRGFGRTKARLERPHFRRILIIKPSSLGDVVRTIPVVRGLRRRYPKARLFWLVRPDCAGVLEGMSCLDQIILFDRKRLGGLAWNPLAFVGFIKLIRQLRRLRCDIVLDMQGLFRSGFLGWISGAGICVGFRNAREGAGIFYTHKIDTPEKEHIATSLWRFADALGFGQTEKDYTLELPASAARDARQILAQHQLIPGRYVVLLIGGTASTKRWPPEQFARLADWVHDQYDLSCILLGAGQTEQALAQELTGHAAGSVINLIDQTDIPIAAEILRHSRLTIGNDSGPLHIADMFDPDQSDLIALYGPTDPAVVGPERHAAGVIAAGTDLPRTTRYSPAPEHQMNQISLETVQSQVRQLLDKDKKP